MRLFALFAGLAALALVPVPSPGQKAAKEEKHITNSIGMKLARIPAGEFTMGSPKGEKNRLNSETQHEVRITKAFYLGIHTVTQKQFRRVMGYNPSHFSKDGRKRDADTRYFHYSLPGGGKAKVEDLDTSDFPVENVSWVEAKEFCDKLSAMPEEKKAGRVYRLPTEAEWEYSCRGGAAKYSAFHFGNELNGKQANCDGSLPYGTKEKGPSLGRTCKVGSYKANGYGLYDMHGNVWQWCSDWYGDYPAGRVIDPTGPDESSDRVIRGGNWGGYGWGCRSASRYGFDPASRNRNGGFRAALVPR